MAQYDLARTRQQQDRDAARRQREAAATRRKDALEQKRAYVNRRRSETEDKNALIERRNQMLESLLISGLRRAVVIDAESRKRTAVVPRLQLGPLQHAEPEPRWQDYAPATPGLWRRTFGDPAKLEDETIAAKNRFRIAQQRHVTLEQSRLSRVRAAQHEHQLESERIHAEVTKYNTTIDAFMRRVAKRSPHEVARYLHSVVREIPMPAGFPADSDVIFDQANEHAVLQITLPGPEVVPAVKSFKYVQAQDQIVKLARTLRERSDSYRRVVAQVIPLTARDVFLSDKTLRQISINARVHHINPSTGSEETPHIVSVVIERDDFESLVLDRVQPEKCLRHLGALVSAHPFELEPVRPLIEFEKSRIAFVKGRDAVSSLDSRPDLMAMSPTEFEHLVRQLLEADPTVLDVESLTTRQSNDGGVDGVVYIRQALGRSMTVVQAKQYSRNQPIGPAHIRELIGAMHETKAGNGILVTTSRFTAGAIKSAEEFGRIQRIDGNNLVHMIKELLGKDVLIGPSRVK